MVSLLAAELIQLVSIGASFAIYWLLLLLDLIYFTCSMVTFSWPLRSAPSSSGQHPKPLEHVGIIITDGKTPAGQLQAAADGILAALASSGACSVTVHEAFSSLQLAQRPRADLTAMPSPSPSPQLQILRSSPETTVRSWQALWSPRTTAHAACGVVDDRTTVAHATRAHDGSVETGAHVREHSAVHGGSVSCSPSSDAARAQAQVCEHANICEACGRQRCSAREVVSCAEESYLDRCLRRSLPPGTFANLDLILVVGPVLCLAGLPPWQARFGEIQHLGTLRSRAEAVVRTHRALARYHRTLQRFGK